MLKITVTINEKTYNHIVNNLRKEYENAKEMSEYPDQKWKEAWKEEADKLFEMWQELIKFEWEEEEIPF